MPEAIELLKHAIDFVGETAAFVVALTALVAAATGCIKAIETIVVRWLGKNAGISQT